MSYTVEETFARETVKMLSRDIYGIMKKATSKEDMVKTLIKGMVLDLLEDEAVNDFLTDEEQARLEGLIIMKS